MRTKRTNHFWIKYSMLVIAGIIIALLLREGGPLGERLPEGMNMLVALIIVVVSTPLISFYLFKTESPAADAEEASGDGSTPEN